MGSFKQSLGWLQLCTIPMYCSPVWMQTPFIRRTLVRSCPRPADDIATGILRCVEKIPRKEVPMAMLEHCGEKQSTLRQNSSCSACDGVGDLSGDILKINNDGMDRARPEPHRPQAKYALTVAHGLGLAALYSSRSCACCDAFLLVRLYAPTWSGWVGCHTTRRHTSPVFGHASSARGAGRPHVSSAVRANDHAIAQMRKVRRLL
jgi:hypothetical protein